MTFRDNARIKAEAAAKAAGLPAFADDSGLVVDALGGEPGIHSARWAGPDRNFRRAMETIEQKLRERGATTPNAARRISSPRCASPGRTAMWRNSKARVDGTLVWPPRGDKGFGYDPMFLPDGHARTFGEMSSEEKHGLPPRGRRPVASGPRLSSSSRRRALSDADPSADPPPQAGEAEKPSASTCTGRSACRNVPIATSTATSATTAIDEARFVRAFTAEIAATAARVPGRTVSTIFFGGGTPSLMQPATVAAVLDAIARHWTRRARRRGHARSQSDQRRGRRASAATAQPASTACRSACRRSTIARSPSSGGCIRRAKRSTPSASRARVFDRYSFDLIYARPQQTPQDWASELSARARRGRRASFALSADHRAGHAVRGAPRGRQAQNSRRGHRARPLRHDAGDLRRARPAGLRDFQSCAARRRMPAQSHLLARARICRHRAGRPRPARHRRRPTRHRDRKAPGSVAHARRGERARSRHRRRAHARGNGRRVPAHGACGSPKASIRCVTRRWPAARSIRRALRRCANTVSSRRPPPGACASACPASPCSTRWWPIWRRR